MTFYGLSSNVMTICKQCRKILRAGELQQHEGHLLLQSTVHKFFQRILNAKHSNGEYVIRW